MMALIILVLKIKNFKFVEFICKFINISNEFLREVHCPIVVISLGIGVDLRGK